MIQIIALSDVAAHSLDLIFATIAHVRGHDVRSKDRGMRKVSLCCRKTDENGR